MGVGALIGTALARGRPMVLGRQSVLTVRGSGSAALILTLAAGLSLAGCSGQGGAGKIGDHPGPSLDAAGGGSGGAPAPGDSGAAGDGPAPPPRPLAAPPRPPP